MTEIDIPLLQGLSLKIDSAYPRGRQYPTLGLQRGLLLLDSGQDLAEEAVGFGVPVLKKGLQTLFPGAVDLEHRQVASARSIIARFQLNLVEKLSQGAHGNVENPQFYALKNLLAATIRHVPVSRGPLTATSSRLRRIFNWETAYAESGFSTELTVIYSLQEGTGRITVEVDTDGLPPGITEVVLMNEQGAHHFDRYRDSSGIRLDGEHIGCWDEVRAEEAWFESTAHRLTFRLRSIKGARLFRGRELVDSRLAWAGFGYSFPPSLHALRYELSIERLA